MNAWLQQLDSESLLVGLLTGLLLALLAAWLSYRNSRKSVEGRLLPELKSAREQLEAQAGQIETAAERRLQQAEELSALAATRDSLREQLGRLQDQFTKDQEALQAARRQIANSEQERARLDTRLQEKEQHFDQQLKKLEAAEQRLAESFERLAGKVFEDRSKRLDELNSKQLDTLLKPLSEKLTEFRNTVTESHKEGTAQHRVLQEKLKELEGLNQRLHDEAANLTKALTSQSKTQGNWGEQQLERLLELAGLVKGREYSTQVSVTTDGGARVQPDLVLHLPEGKSIVMDSKVSLTDWVRYQAEEDENQKAAHLAAHVRTIKNQIKELGEKRYTEVGELNALDFVLMFVPIEAALIAALQSEPELPGFALERKVALVSPTNLLATLRTVASVWLVHKQNNNAQEIAKRAGLLYDKFVGFVDNLRLLGNRLEKAREAYDDAFGQLSTGAGNLVRQTEMLKELGARNTKQLDQQTAAGASEEKSLRLVKDDE